MKRLVKVVAALAAACWTVQASAKDVADNYTLAADEDWSGEGNLNLAAGKTIDVAGHKLTFRMDAAPANAGTITSSVQGGEVRLIVPENVTIKNTTLAMNGSLKVVAEGPGTYKPSIKSEFTGGLYALGGTLQADGWGGDRKTGVANGEIHVGSGATIEMGGMINFHDYMFVLDGGTLQNTTGSISSPWTRSMIAHAVVTADSAMKFTVSSYGFINSGYAAATLDLQGHTLDLTSKSGYLANLSITAGTINLRGGVEIYRGPLVAPEVTFNMYGSFFPNGQTADIGGLICHLKAEDEISGYEAYNGTVFVHHLFKPVEDCFNGCTLKDGCMLDLHERTGVWSVTSTTCRNNKLLRFEDNATITLDLTGRTFAAGDKIIAWEAPPNNVKFVTNITLPGKLMPLADGLYVMEDAAGAETEWIGADSDKMWSNPANWSNGVPEMGGIAKFLAGTATTVVNDPFILNQLYIGSGAGVFTHTGESTLTIQKAITNLSVNSQFFKVPLALGVSGEPFAIHTSSDLTMTNGNGVALGASVFTKSGAGTLVIDDTAIAGAGDVTILEGLMKLNTTGKQTVAGNAGTLTIAPGAMLDLNLEQADNTTALEKGEATHAKTIVLSGTGIDGEGALINSATSDNWGGALSHLVLVGDASIGSSKATGARTDLRALTGSASTNIAVEGAYTLTINSGNYFDFLGADFQLHRLDVKGPCQFEGANTGCITNGIHLLDGSAVTLWGSTALPASFQVEPGAATTMTVGSASTLQPEISVTVPEGASLSLVANADVTQLGTVTNHGMIVKSGGSSWYLNGPVVGDGDLTVTAGYLRLSDATDFSQYGGVISATGGVLSFGRGAGSTLPSTSLLSKIGGVASDVHFWIDQDELIAGEYDDIVNGVGAAKKSVKVLTGVSAPVKLTLEGANWELYRFDLASANEYGNLILNADTRVSVSHEFYMGVGESAKSSLLEVNDGATFEFGDESGETFQIGNWSHASDSTHEVRVNGGTLRSLDNAILVGQDSPNCYLNLVSGLLQTKGITVRNRTNYSMGYAHDERYTQTGGVLEMGDGGFATATGKTDGKTHMDLRGGVLKAVADFAVNQGGMINAKFGTDPADVYEIDLNGHTVTWNTALQGAGQVTIKGNGSFISSSKYQGVPEGLWKVEANATADLSGAADFAGGLTLGENATATVELGAENYVEFAVLSLGEFADTAAVTNYYGVYPYQVSNLNRLHTTSGSPEVNNCYFCYRGQFYVPTAATYYFAANYDDDITLEIDGELAVSSSGWTTVTAGQRELAAGWHDFRAFAHDATGGQGPHVSGWENNMSLGWTTDASKAGSTKASDYQRFDTTTIQMRPGIVRWARKSGYDQLGTEPFNGTVSGFKNTLQFLRTADSAIANELSKGNQCARLTGRFYAETAGTYTFTGIYDDIMALNIDGTRLFQTPAWNKSSTASAELAVGWHAFDIRIADNSGGVGHANALVVKKPGESTAVPFDEENLQLDTLPRGLGGVTTLGKGAVLGNQANAVCPIYGTLAGSGSLDGKFAFTSTGIWRVGIDEWHFTDLVNTKQVDGVDFVKDLRKIEVVCASRASAPFYQMCPSGTMTAEAAAAIEVTVKAAEGAVGVPTDLVWKATIRGGYLGLVNPQPAGLTLFVR